MYEADQTSRLSATPAGARALLGALETIDYGRLELTLPDGKTYAYEGAQDGVQCRVTLHTWDVLSVARDQSDVGLGEAYIKEQWATDSLPDFLIFVCQNERALQKAFRFGALFNLFLRFRNFLRKNSKAGSRRNIMSHYDVGNEFYKLWLDPSMTYSSGLYQGEVDLQTSQKNKMDHAFGLLEPEGDANILEVGCGWGSLLEHGVGKGFAMEGITISPSQKSYCEQRLGREDARVSLLDYRDLKKRFDHIVSIEMFEAVGQEYWKTFLGKMNQSLKPGGSAVIQTITIRDDLFDTYRKSSDFIRSHVFPGGFLPSASRFRDVAEKMKFRVEKEVAFGMSYAKTLRAWLDNFNNAAQEIKDMGYDERFIRTWQFYLATCIAGFSTQRTDVYQFRLVQQ